MNKGDRAVACCHKKQTKKLDCNELLNYIL